LRCCGGQQCSCRAEVSLLRDFCGMLVKLAFNVVYAVVGAGSRGIEL